jgi:hypothetical protein
LPSSLRTLKLQYTSLAQELNSYAGLFPDCLENSQHVAHEDRSPTSGALACHEVGRNVEGPTPDESDPLFMLKPPTTTKGVSVVTILAESDVHRTGEDLEAQREARDAIMEIPAFPELQTRLTRVFGPGAERDMVHQLVYWFSKPKMQNRWTAYLTRENWRDQRGLNRKQVDKGRRRLKAHHSGVVVEKMGPYKRVHYRIDWVKLADLLGLEIPLKGVPMDDDFEDFYDFDEEVLRTPPRGTPKPSDPPLEVADSSDPPPMDDTPDIYAENPSSGGVPTNTGTFPEAFPQDNSPLQGGAEPAIAEPAPPPINKEIEPQEDYLPSLPDTDKRHSQVLEPPKPKISKEVEHKVYALIFGLPNETAVTRFADHYIECNVDADGEPFTVERVAEKAREHLGGDEPLEAYTPWVRRCLEDKRVDLMEVAS